MSNDREGLISYGAGDDRTGGDDPLRILEQLADSAGIHFDRIFARRALGEAMRAIPGDDGNAWIRRLVEVGESLELRVRSLDCTLSSALAFVRGGVPVATCVDGQSSGRQWLLLAEVRGRRVRVVTTASGDRGRWISMRRASRLLGLEETGSVRRWVVGQAALTTNTPQEKAAGPRTPFARLLVLLRPERRDLIAVLVFSIVVGVLALASPIAVEALVNTVAFGRYLQPVVVLALILLVFLGFAAAMRGFMAYVIEILQQRLFVRVVEDLAYRLPRAQQTAFDRVYGPELVNRFFDVVTVQKVVATLLLDGLAIVLQTVIGMVVLAFYHPFLLGFDAVLLMLIGFVIFGLGRGAVRTAVKESKAKYAVAAWLQELVRHPTAFKLHAGTQFALDRADRLAVSYLETRRAHFRVVLRQFLFVLAMQAIAATVLLGLGGWLVIQGQLTLGQLVAAELIVMTIVGGFAKLGKHVESFYDLLASVDKLGALFDLPLEPHDQLSHLKDGVPAAVRVNHVDAGSLHSASLKGLCFEIRPRESVALRGPHDQGSLLIDILCGFRQPSRGHIELDGLDLRQLRPDNLREHLGVARGIEIFSGSIDENVHLNRPQISPQDVREALKLTGLLDELLALPEGLNTQLTTGGHPLSRSQAARLMIARAIVGRPRLLLIDGTLDLLDAELVDCVMASLRSSESAWSMLVASSRREVVAHCDRSLDLAASSQTGQTRAGRESEVDAADPHA